MRDLLRAALRIAYRLALRPACAHQGDRSICETCLEARV